MALNIRNPVTEELAAKLAQLTGESKTEAVTKALQERLTRVKRHKTQRSLSDDLDTIAIRCSRLPRLDERSDEEILGYDEMGVPH